MIHCFLKDLASHSDHELWEVDVLFINRKLVDVP